jgi:ribokinase
VLIVFGSVNLDLAFALPRLPLPGETVLGPHAVLGPGGKGANQACAAARDGAQVAMAGAVGRDALAGAALAGLRAAGVDLARVAELDATTGCAAVCTDEQGRNLIAVGAGANLLARADQVEDALLGPGALLLCQMECDPAETAALIGRARGRGARTVLNLAPAFPLDPAALRALSLLLVNEHEAAWLAGQLGGAADAAGLRRALGDVDVVRTLGERGAEWSAAEGEGSLPSRPVQAVDTAGAGDCFAGVLAAALDRGAPLAHAIARANAAAALSCTRPGTQASLPDAAEIDVALA